MIRLEILNVFGLFHNSACLVLPCILYQRVRSAILTLIWKHPYTGSGSCARNGKNGKNKLSENDLIISGWRSHAETAWTLYEHDVVSGTVCSMMCCVIIPMTWFPLHHILLVLFLKYSFADSLMFDLNELNAWFFFSCHQFKCFF